MDAVTKVSADNQEHGDIAKKKLDGEGRRVAEIWEHSPAGHEREQ